MGRITLYRNVDGWFADMSAATGAAGIRTRFGTDQLPTCYTARADWREVQARIAALNPSDEVQVHDSVFAEVPTPRKVRLGGASELERDTSLYFDDEGPES